eukprot:352775-Chlamydomonas_euryale.AAC.8
MGNYLVIAATAAEARTSLLSGTCAWTSSSSCPPPRMCPSMCLVILLVKPPPISPPAALAIVPGLTCLASNFPLILPSRHPWNLSSQAFQPPPPVALPPSLQ